MTEGVSRLRRARSVGRHIRSVPKVQWSPSFGPSITKFVNLWAGGRGRRSDGKRTKLWLSKLRLTGLAHLDR